MNFHQTTQAVAKAIDPYARKKYRPGPVLKTFDQLLDAAARGVWIFCNHKAYHPSWAQNWPIGRIKTELDNGHIRIGIRNKAFPLVFEANFIQSKVSYQPSAWWLKCDEIPKSYELMPDLSMTSVINRAFEIARNKGHFGEVKVLFWKECPF